MSKERMEELERKSVCVKRKDGRVRERVCVSKERMEE